MLSSRDWPIAEPIDISSVAFADDDRFFATLSTPAERYLVEGSLAGRRLVVVGSGVANEAVSPDGQRLLLKRQTGERGFWQTGGPDLESRSEVRLNQGARSVDDQVEWLDDSHVVYHDVTEDEYRHLDAGDRRRHRPQPSAARRVLARGAALKRGLV